MGRQRQSGRGRYRDYFENCSKYYTTNWSGTRGGQGQKENEFFVDLTASLSDEMKNRFDVVFNHTTLEHTFDVQTAFKNICLMSRDIVIVVVPFAQAQHESESWGDFWRFSPSCVRNLFKQNGMETIYEATSPEADAAVYVIAVGSKNPEKWRSKMPKYEKSDKAGDWIGRSLISRMLKSVRSNSPTENN